MKENAGAKIRQTIVKVLRTPSVAEGRDGEGRLKEDVGVMTRETKVKTLPHRQRGRGSRLRKAKTNGKWKGGTTYRPARGGSA